MKILVLGGTGAMGSCLVNISSAAGCNVHVTSRKQYKEACDNIRYIVGNAKQSDFLNSVLRECHYDAIIDFMSYTTKEFEARYKKFLDSTDQYVFLSSCRVYADSEILTETSERLIDTCKDAEYLQTDEYALAKARQEDLLINSGQNNWTIVRPYITYNSQRLQLGFLEKEQWLYRVLNGKTIVFSKDIAERETTLTYGGDVAQAIYDILGKPKALGQVYQITQADHLKWKDILQVYFDTIEEITGKRPKIILEETHDRIANVVSRIYPSYYDRLYDRIFDSSKIKEISPMLDHAKRPQEGLKICMTEFFNNGSVCGRPDWRYEGFADKVSKEKTDIREINGMKNRIRYFLARYTSIYEKRHDYNFGKRRESKRR